MGWGGGVSFRTFDFLLGWAGGASWALLVVSVEIVSLEVKEGEPTYQVGSGDLTQVTKLGRPFTC